MTSEPPNLASRRMFFSHGQQHFQIFTFEQRSDGSIYVSSPSFEDTKWVVVHRDPVSISVEDAPGSKKLSVHGSGVVHVKADALPTIRLKGCPLLFSETDGGVRHVLTSAISEPCHRPSSPAFNRSADFAVESSDGKPVVFVFWAVPLVSTLTVEIAGQFHVDDLESLPPAVAMGAFHLRKHSIVWLAYRTRHMSSWPKHTYSVFDDGYHVPLIIGAAEKMHRLELRAPKYAYQENHLSISV